jgi:hypothetical protein
VWRGRRRRQVWRARARRRRGAGRLPPAVRRSPRRGRAGPGAPARSAAARSGARATAPAGVGLGAERVRVRWAGGGGMRPARRALPARAVAPPPRRDPRTALAPAAPARSAPRAAVAAPPAGCTGRLWINAPGLGPRRAIPGRRGAPPPPRTAARGTRRRLPAADEGLGPGGRLQHHREAGGRPAQIAGWWGVAVRGLAAVKGAGFVCTDQTHLITTTCQLTRL